MFVAFSIDPEASNLYQIRYSHAIPSLHYNSEAVLGQGATKVRVEGFELALAVGRLGLCDHGFGSCHSEGPKALFKLPDLHHYPYYSDSRLGPRWVFLSF